MSTLHIVNKSCHSNQALQRCLSLSASGDSILLIEDGVYAAHDSDATLLSKVPGINWYALDSDLAARGVTQVSGKIEQVDYMGFVELVCKCRNSVSWS
jgi:tRNA 2-thiouridine synthesizing protein B